MRDNLKDFVARHGQPKRFLGLVIPTLNRDSQPIEHGKWVAQAEDLLRDCFGRTDSSQALGAWSPIFGEQRKGNAYKPDVEDTTIVFCDYGSEQALLEAAPRLREFIRHLCSTTPQKAFGLFIDFDYLEVPFS